MRGNEANISNVFPVQSGMRHRGHLAGPTTRVHVVAAGARFFLDTGARIELPASSVCCQEIYLRRRRYVFGRPRTANNSLICLYLPLKFDSPFSIRSFRFNIILCKHLLIIVLSTLDTHAVFEMLNNLINY